MKVVIGIYDVGKGECFQRKDKIVHYLTLQKSFSALSRIVLIDLSTKPEESGKSTKDMQRAADLVQANVVSKAILICKTGRTASNIARDAGATMQDLAVQNETPLHKVHRASLLALGYSFDWESTQQHLDAFLK